MTGRGRKLRIAAAVAVATGGLLAAGAVAPPVAARPQPGFTVKEGSTATRSYPAIPNAYPRAFMREDAPVLTPADCVTEPTSRMCDTIKIQVEPADVPEFEDWFVEIQLSYEKYGNGLELDMYMWDDLQINQREDPDSTTYTQLAAAATSANPEVIALLKPTLGTYNLTVVNWLGDNKGYTLTGRIKYGDPFERPDELLEEEGGGGVQESQDISELPVDFSDISDLEAAFGSTDTVLETIDYIADGDLDAAGLGGGIGGLPQAPMLPGELAAAEPPGPASGVLLVLSLIVVPLALAGGGAAAVLRYTGRNRMGFA